MMRAASILVLALASGCTVQMNGGAAVLGVAVIAATLDAREDYSLGRSPSYKPAPEMAADRVVAEQDCTKPIEDWSANLKCR